jgi:hypothetical protein
VLARLRPDEGLLDSLILLMHHGLKIFQRSTRLVRLLVMGVIRVVVVLAFLLLDIRFIKLLLHVLEVMLNMGTQALNHLLCFFRSLLAACHLDVWLQELLEQSRYRVQLQAARDYLPDVVQGDFFIMQIQ